MAYSAFGNRCRVLMAAAKSAAASTASAAKPKAAEKPKLGKPTPEEKPKSTARGSGITKLQTVSPALAKFIGSPEASRSDAVKKIWDYAKSNNLQNPDNKKEIYCDDKLKVIFDGNDKVNFQQVAKLLSNHFPKTT